MSIVKSHQYNAVHNAHELTVTDHDCLIAHPPTGALASLALQASLASLVASLDLLIIALSRLSDCLAMLAIAAAGP